MLLMLSISILFLFKVFAYTGFLQQFVVSIIVYLSIVYHFACHFACHFCLIHAPSSLLDNVNIIDLFSQHLLIPWPVNTRLADQYNSRPIPRNNPPHFCSMVHIIRPFALDKPPVIAPTELIIRQSRQQ